VAQLRVRQLAQQQAGRQAGLQAVLVVAQEAEEAEESPLSSLGCSALEPQLT
tara:strand:- start:89 stop:244 length:156 start_codon:yes stop_codon:yes gene_type:complete